MAASPLKRWFRRGRAELLGALFWLLGWVPLRAALALGAALGALAFRLLGRERTKALDHLAIAFPERPAAERAAIARGCFVQLGRSALEITQLAKLDIKSYVEWPAGQIEDLGVALARGRGGILVLGHLGNWELVGPRLVAEGFGGAAIGRDSGDLALARKIESFRRRQGVPVVARTNRHGGGSGATRALLRALRTGKLVAVLLDQDTRVQSQFVPFFGRLASTPSAAESLARLGPGCCALAVIHRKPEGGHLLTTELVDLALPALTARLTARLEAEIRRHPTEWVWMHERWKQRPPEEEPRQSGERPAERVAPPDAAEI